MISVKNILYPVLSIMVLVGVVDKAAAQYKGIPGFDLPKEPKTKQERKKRRPAKMQDVMWDKATQGMVRIFCKPSANLYVNGELQRDPKGKRSKSEKFAVALPVGSHVLRLERDGFEPQEKRITIEAGKPYSENFVLMKKGLKRGEMALIPAGEFWMGIDKYDLDFIVQKIGGEKRFHRNESPRSKESVAAFYMDKYEVTNAQYQEFAGATKREVLPDDWENGTYPGGKADFPVVYVTWHDANEYCQWAGKRLPTEKEWEKAARWAADRNATNKNDDSTLYPWGNRFNRNRANTATGGPGHTSITGQYEHGKSAYGIYDMSGNVKEWVTDWYQDYPGSKFKDEFAAEEKVKLARGGSFLERHEECLTSCRYKHTPGTAYEDLGFRCAKDAK